MKRSLKLYLFWQLLLTTIVIILANRLIAQYFVFDSFKHGGIKTEVQHPGFQ